MDYLFQATHQSAANTIRQQMRKVCEEATELREAVETAAIDIDIIDEALDTIHACEGLLRKYPADLVDSRIIEVRLKNKRRGYYDMERI